MGLSYAQEYSCRDHFRQKSFWALWRRWSAPEQVDQPTPPSLSPYDSNVVQPANTEAYVASDGVIFVCNIKSRNLSPVLRRLITMSLGRRKLIRTFTTAMSLLSKRHEPLGQSLSTQRKPRSCLKTLGRIWMTFYRLSQTVKNGQLSERNSQRLEELLSKFQCDRRQPCRIIENKRGDYHF